MLLVHRLTRMLKIQLQRRCATDEPLLSSPQRESGVAADHYSVDRGELPFLGTSDSVMFVKKAKDLWDELRQRFSQGNHMRLADLNEELYLLRQEPKIVAAMSQGRGNANSEAGSGNKNYNNKNKFGKNNTKMWTFCGRSGHTVDTCFKKHGYPPNQKK
ncbi:hypothetical protein PIB30_045257 [Stylosanthes scabra]|uniref:Uncharacterized protein n=1 Tax=Stylosanthes scabra TaxID=79078 RepID=A0ABU6ZEU4_9FABA|nr:hypothetical protein [Stylosanthes scabra]